MRLQRRKSHSEVSHEQRSAQWESYGGDDAFTDFERFGDGPSNFSWLRVLLTWEDVEAIVNAMAEEKHQKALRVQKALRLADSVEDILKTD